MCFQSHPLDFVGETQWYQFGANRTSRRVFGDIKAVQTDTGTWPEGSSWRRKLPRYRCRLGCILLKMAAISLSTGNPIPACHSPNGANGYSRGGANQTFFPNKGGPVSCSKEAFRCPPKGIDDPTPTAPCDPEVGDSSKFAFDGLYEGPQFEPVGGWPGRFADEGIYTYGFGASHPPPPPPPRIRLT